MSKTIKEIEKIKHENYRSIADYEDSSIQETDASLIQDNLNDVTCLETSNETCDMILKIIKENTPVPNTFKETIEIETLKALSYTEINKLLTDLYKENEKLKNTPVTSDLEELRKWIIEVNKKDFPITKESITRTNERHNIVSEINEIQQRNNTESKPSQETSKDWKDIKKFVEQEYDNSETKKVASCVNRILTKMIDLELKEFNVVDAKEIKP